MGKKTIANQIHSALVCKIAYGESKHNDKIENNLKFGESNYKIYSFDTYDTYSKVGKEYAKWLSDKGIKYGSFAHTECYVKEYIETRLDDGKSIYTLKMERSALSMLYGHRIEVSLPERHSLDVIRSRLKTKNDKHMSRSRKYADVFITAVSSGCRRCDIS